MASLRFNGHSKGRNALGTALPTLPRTSHGAPSSRGLYSPDLSQIPHGTMCLVPLRFQQDGEDETVTSVSGATGVVLAHFATWPEEPKYHINSRRIRSSSILSPHVKALQADGTVLRSSHNVGISFNCFRRITALGRAEEGFRRSS